MTFTVREHPGAGTTARAYFVCQRCYDAGTMTEPVELPVASRACPLCGKRKWLQRIWSGPTSAPAISKGIAKFVDSAAEPAWEQAARLDAIKQLAATNPVRAVPIRNLSAHLQSLGMPVGATRVSIPQEDKARPIAMTHPVLSQVPGPPRVVADGSTKVDREWKVVKRGDRVEMEKI